MTKDEKSVKVDELSKQQLCLVRKSIALSKKPLPRRNLYIIRRAATIVSISIRVRQLEMQKHIIMATPTPKFPIGAYKYEGVAILGSGPSEIILKNQRVIV